MSSTGSSDFKYARVTGSRCHVCGAALDCATSVSSPGTLPKEGDISICVGCGEVAQFDADLRRKPVLLSSLPLDVREQIARMQQALREALPPERN